MQQSLPLLEAILDAWPGGGLEKTVGLWSRVESERAAPGLEAQVLRGVVTARSKISGSGGGGAALGEGVRLVVGRVGSTWSNGISAHKARRWRSHRPESSSLCG